MVNLSPDSVMRLKSFSEQDNNNEVGKSIWDNSDQTNSNSTIVNTPNNPITISPDSINNLKQFSNPIDNSNKQFTGAEYEGGDMFNSDPNITKVRQQQLYNEQIKNADSSFLGLPTQKFETSTGDKRTSLIPAPPSDSPINDFLGESILGGTLKAAQEFGSFGEWVAENIPSSVPGIGALHQAIDLSDQLLGTNIKTTEFVKENLPTYPASNDLEAMSQEVVSVIVGTVAGEAALAPIIEKIGPKAAQYFYQYYQTAKKLDPINAEAKLATGIKAFMTNMAGGVGGTIATDDKSKPLTETLGLPNQYPGMDEQTSRNINTTLDNTAIPAIASLGLKIFGKGLGFVGDKLAGGVFKDASNTAKVTQQFFSQIDPNFVPDMPAQQVASNLKIMSDIVDSNTNFKAFLEGQEYNIPTTSAVAVQQGAEEYIAKAYAHQLQGLTPELAQKKITDDANELIDNFIGFKRGRVLQGNITNSNSSMDNQIVKSMDDASQRIAPLGTQELVGQQLGGEIANPLKEIRDQFVLKDQATKVATANVGSEQQKNALINLLEDARSKNLVGSDAAEKQTLQQLATDDLFNAWTRNKKEVDDLYAAIPRTPFNNLKLSEDINSIQNKENIGTLLGLGSKNIKANIPADTLDETGQLLSSGVEDFSNRLDEVIPDFHTAFNEVLPMISRKIDEVKGANLKADVSDLIALRDSILNQADESADPAIQKATAAYRDFADTWLQTPQLREFDANMRNVKVDNEGNQFNRIDADTSGINALTQSIDSPNTEVATKFINALTKYNPVAGDNLGEVYLAEAIRAIRNTDNPSQIITMMESKLPALEKTNAPSVEMYRKAITALKDAETNVISKQQMQELIENTYNQLLSDGTKKEAIKFVEKATGKIMDADPRVVSNSSAVFDTMFNSKQGLGQISRLIDQAGDNQLAKDGIRAYFLQWLIGKTHSTKAVATDMANGSGIVRDASGANLKSILTDPSNPTLDIIAKLYDEKTAEGLKAMIQMADRNVNLNSTQVQTYGSNTIANAAAMESASTLTRIMFGMLNRTATIVGGIARPLTKGLEDSQNLVINRTLDELVTNPTFLSEALDYAAQDKSGKLVTQYLAKVLQKGTGLFGRGAIAASKGVDENTNNQMNQLFNPIEDDPMRVQYTN